MKIERRSRGVRKHCEPLLVGGRHDGARELQRGRIARIARQSFFMANPQRNTHAQVSHPHRLRPCWRWKIVRRSPQLCDRRHLAPSEDVTGQEATFGRYGCAVRSQVSDPPRGCRDRLAAHRGRDRTARRRDPARARLPHPDPVQ